MATQEIRNTALPAPYLPFKTFLGSLDPFTQGIPPKIDRSLWNQSGFVQGLILNAYRYFHLVDVNDKPTPEFQQLVKSKNEERKKLVKKFLLDIGYPEIVLMHDLATMTPKMLEELMDKYNVSGETKKKAITFFLQAAKFADVPLSSFLTEKIRNTSGPRRRKNGAKGEGDTRIERQTVLPSGSSGTTRSVILSGGGTVALTVSVDLFSLGKDDREFVFGLIDRLQQYETEHSSDEDEAENEQV